MLPPEFTKQVTEAYEHLYDIVFLRTHPLTDTLVPDPAVDRKDKAWQLHRLLIDAVEELKPDPNAPASSHERRRYQLVARRYVDGLDPQRVADELGISRRHYYRTHSETMEAVAEVLWERRSAAAAAAAAPMPAPEAHADRLELLRLEVARLAHADRYTNVREVIQGVLLLFQDRLALQQMHLDQRLAEDLPDVAVDRNLLRQMLLTILGYFAGWASQATLCVTAQEQASTLLLRLSVESADVRQSAPSSAAEECLSVLNELAGLSQVRVEPWPSGQDAAGFTLHLPVGGQRTVLVVDDNEDILELFGRYLTLHRYRVAPARSAGEALALAQQLQPYAIILDLMMPEQDGWDVLQALLNQPSTQHIPVIVCSVLRARELALYLGAAAFLPKPVTEDALVGALEKLSNEVK